MNNKIYIAPFKSNKLKDNDKEEKNKNGDKKKVKKLNSNPF
jgi:hypothetical protein